MNKILFICHGNICRSPMAEYVMKKLVNDAGLKNQFVIASAATSTEEIGNPVYPPVKSILNHHGINCKEKRARQISLNDYYEFDYLIAMDHWNVMNMKRFFKNDPDCKISLLMDYTNHPGDVADPWYTDDFETTWNDINKGCTALLSFLLENNSYDH